MKYQKLIHIISIIFILFITSCHSNTDSASSENQTVTSISQNENTHAENISITSIVLINGTTLELEKNSTQNLFLAVSLNNGKTYHGITKYFQNFSNSTTDTVIWYSNNQAVAQVSAYGIVTAISAGTTTILATLENKSTYLTVTVTDSSLVIPAEAPSDTDISTDGTADSTTNSTDTDTTSVSQVSQNTDTENTQENTSNTIQSEPPNNASEYFLNENDSFTTSLGINGGSGFEDYPDVLFGPPSDLLDVLSLGVSGEIIIELKNYIIVNADGSDFTIFENPAYDYFECATVSVSDDGANYHSFSCDPINSSGNFAQCAGLHYVNYGLPDESYLDPTLSGGDSFDLNDLTDGPLDAVRFIKIKDEGLCETGVTEIEHGYSGFDLDAIAIVHGLNI